MTRFFQNNSGWLALHLGHHYSLTSNVSQFCLFQFFCFLIGLILRTNLPLPTDTDLLPTMKFNLLFCHLRVVLWSGQRSCSLNCVTASGFPRKRKWESGSHFFLEYLAYLKVSASLLWNYIMAGQYSKPTSSRSGRRRESLEGTSHEQSLPWDVEFIQKLRKLPDELTRLYSENSTLKREAEGSPSR